MKTGWITHPRCVEHDTGPGHPERPARWEAVTQRLVALAGVTEMPSERLEPVDDAWLQAVHAPEYLDRLGQACGDGKSFIDSPDSRIGPDSGEIARLASAAVRVAGDEVMAGDLEAAFCAIRPPGHHAEVDRSMGFCLYNHVALLAEHLKRAYGVKRTAIVDFDVHHGNGTQHIFEARRDVLFVSLHQDPSTLYPGTGFAHETGEGDGEGFTLNIPMDPGSGDTAWEEAMRDTVVPRVTDFAPEALLVSAGFDAAAADPLAGCEVSERGFATIGEQLAGIAVGAGIPMVATLEGGYDLDALADGVEALVTAMADG